jgi:hypothetical protein
MSLETNANQDNDSRGSLIFRIRRFFTIPYIALRNTPETPPYDAESAALPAHEKSGGARRDTSETISDMYQTEGGARASRGQESSVCGKYHVTQCYV